MVNLRILLVEDESLLVGLYTRMLEMQGYHVAASVPTAEAALQLSTDLSFDVLLTDVMLAGDINGITLANILNSRLETPTVIMSSLDKDELMEVDDSFNEYEWLLKPFTMEQLNDAIVRACEKPKRLQETDT